MIFGDPLKQLAEYELMEQDLCRGRGPVQAGGLTDGAKAYMACSLAPDTLPWKLFVTYDETRARELAEDIGCFTDNVFVYPARDMLFYSADIRGNLISSQRIDIRRHVTGDAGGCVVTVVDGLMDKLEEPEMFRGKRIHLKADGRIEPAELESRLTDFGYERVAQVDGPGQYAVRGGIIDVYPLTEDYPVRIELWDEDIDSMKSFDTVSQRSIENKDEVLIYPAGEELLGGSASFLRYFDPEKTLICVDEPVRVNERALVLTQEYTEGVAGRIEAGQADPEELPELFTPQEIAEDLASARTLYMTGLDVPVAEGAVKRAYSLTVRNAASYRNAFDMLIADLKHYRDSGYMTVVLSASRTRTSRLAESLREYGVSAYVPDPGELPELAPGTVAVMYGNLHKGFEFPLIRFAVISESDIFGGRRSSRKRRKKHFDYDGTEITSLSQLSVGDYVVHEEHGLGVYRGIEQIERDHVIKDYIKIEYAGGDNCYVPVTKLEVIQKYSDGGEGERRPRLNKLGGGEWARTKAGVRKAVAEIAAELVELYAARLNGKGYTYGPDTVWQKEFEEMFEFDETEDQLRAIEDVKHDMESGKIMDRLICGDVGYGKTEVAIRAAFKVIQEGRQVIYLVPTTILAQQHYNTFTQRMHDFPVHIEMISRFRTAAEQKKIIADTKAGRIDILIGTHRILSKDVEFKKLGLLIVDEEQRFGVTHKEKIKQMRGNVDVLTLTATPIPRTLHMSLSGIRDMSVLDEPPVDRLPIQTFVMEHNDEIIREAINREMARGGQVYYVNSRIAGIDDVAQNIQSLVPEANVVYAHGRMSEHDLESIMFSFVNGDIDVLVSTTIIETGLDISNVNTIIIDDADRFGLSQLYQLRGRVGRSNRTAYAFMMYRRDKILKEEAEKRLEAIKEFTELGSGIKIAMRDLEIRGAGNLLGAEQSGHMEAVGYDLYCKMLNQAVRTLKLGEDEAEVYNTSIDLDMDAYIPPTYIRNELQKLDMYKRIATIDTEEAMMDIEEELTDRYGELPPSVMNLIKIALLKAQGHEVYVTSIVQKHRLVKIDFYEKAKLDVAQFPALLDSYGDALRMIPGKVPRFELTLRGERGNASKAIPEQSVLDQIGELFTRLHGLLPASAHLHE